MSIKTGIDPISLLESADEYPDIIAKMVDIFLKQDEEEKRQKMRSKL